jgi:hypothetical protein
MAASQIWRHTIKNRLSSRGIQAGSDRAAETFCQCVDEGARAKAGKIRAAAALKWSVRTASCPTETTRHTALLVTAEQSDWHADGIWLGSMGVWANAREVLTRVCIPYQPRRETYHVARREGDSDKQ